MKFSTYLYFKQNIKYFVNNVSRSIWRNQIDEKPKKTKFTKQWFTVKSDLIISYHPPIFRPLKRLTANSWKERIAVNCLTNRIAVFSPHTSLDAIQAGVPFRHSTLSRTKRNLTMPLRVLMNLQMPSRFPHSSWFKFLIFPVISTTVIY